MNEIKRTRIVKINLRTVYMFANTTTFPLYILIREYPTNVDNKVIDQSNSEYNTMDSATLRKYGVLVPAGHKFPVISVSSKNVDVMFVCFDHGKKKII